MHRTSLRAAARAALPAVFALLAACSVDRYDLQGRVVAGTAGQARQIAPGQLDSTALRPVPYAAVRLLVDADDSLNRRDLGVIRCDGQGRFTLRGVNAPGVEMVPYRLRIEAYAQGFAPLRCEAKLPPPGRALLLRMAEDPASPGAPPGFLSEQQPAQGDALKDALRDGAPYLK